MNKILSTDTISNKISKSLLIILLVGISISVIFVLSVFILGDKSIEGKALVDQLISPLIFFGAILAGVIAGINIKDTIGGKLFYAIITAFLAIISIFLGLILTTIFALSFSKGPW